MPPRDCVSAVGEEAKSILLADQRERPTRSFHQRSEAPGLRFPKQRLDLREGFLYGVEIGRIAWQEHQRATPPLDELAHPLVLCTWRLSITTSCPSFSSGHRKCST